MIKSITKLLIVAFLASCVCPAGAMDFADDIKSNALRISNENAAANSSSDGSGYSGNMIGDQYILGPGDAVAINIIVNGDQKYVDYNFIVSPEGKIFFPKIGEFLLSGKTISEARAQIASEIKKKYNQKIDLYFRLTSPRQIKIYLSGSNDEGVYLMNKNYVNVYGEVGKSGRFDYIPGKHISDYISYAGGPLQRANLRQVTITQKGQKRQVDVADIIYNGKMQNDVEIMPGDVINVPAQFFYFNNFESFTALMFTLLAFYTTFLRQ